MKSVILALGICFAFSCSSLAWRIDMCKNLEAKFQEDCGGVLEDTRFASVSDEVLQWKNSEEDKCGMGSLMKVELHSNDLVDVFSYEVSPSWVLDSPKISACPYSIMKNRDDSRRPKMLAEVVCDCERSGCSMSPGYQCTAVRASIPVERNGDASNELIGVACVCARRPQVKSA